MQNSRMMIGRMISRAASNNVTVSAKYKDNKLYTNFGQLTTVQLTAVNAQLALASLLQLCRTSKLLVWVGGWVGGWRMGGWVVEDYTDNKAILAQLSWSWGWG